MGSEQSQHQNVSNTASYGSARDARSRLSSTAKLQRGNTIAVTGQSGDVQHSIQNDRRPTSPPLSVCSDSDLPYISYTDKPIGGMFCRQFFSIIKYI